jgi:AcrR family transcriptional regulator
MDLTRGKEDLRIVKTKKRLTDALLLLLDKKPLQEIKVTDLCITAKVSRATFYNNFQTITDVLSAYLDSFQSKMEESINAKEKENGLSLSEAYKEFIGEVIDVLSNDRDRMLKILSQNSTADVYDALQGFLLRNISRVLSLYSDQITSMPVPMLSSYFAGAFTGLLTYLVPHASEFTREEMAEDIYRLTFEVYYNGESENLLK